MKIDRYEFGHMTVDGKHFTSDLILLPDRIVSDWWRKEGHGLCLEDLEEVLRQPPDVLVVGRGFSGLMTVSRQIISALEEKGMEVYVDKTSGAVEKFNQFTHERRVAGAFHLTC